MKKILIFFCFLITVFCAVLLTECGRNFLLQRAIGHFLKDASVSVSGVEDTRYIDKIFLKTADGTEITIEKINISRSEFFSIPHFYIDQFTIKTSQSSNSNNHIPLSTLKILPIFTSGIEITNLRAVINDKRYDFDNVKYLTKKQLVTFHSNIYGCFSARLFGFSSVKLSFSDCFDINGTAVIDNLFGNRKAYQIEVQHKGHNIQCTGHFSNPLEEIIVENCRVTKGSYTIKASGILYPQKKEVSANILLKEQTSFIEKISSFLKADPEKIASYINEIEIKIHSKLYGDFLTTFRGEKDDVILTGQLRSENNVVKLNCICPLTLYKHKLSSLDVEFGENISAKLHGENFNVDMLSKKNGNQVVIEKLSYE